jgi:hypothetical protein
MLGRLTFGLGLVACAVALVGNSIGVIRLVDEHARDRKVAGELMRFAEYIDPDTDGKPSGAFFALFPFEGYKVIEAIRAAGAAGFQQHIRDASFSIDSHDLGRVERIEEGRLSVPRTVQTDWSVRFEEVQVVRMAGWVHVRNASLLPDFVFAGCAHSRIFVGVVRLEPQRLVFPREPNLERNKAGWVLAVPVALLPKEGCQLWAWIYDPGMNEFVRLRKSGE